MAEPLLHGQQHPENSGRITSDLRQNLLHLLMHRAVRFSLLLSRPLSLISPHCSEWFHVSPEPLHEPFSTEPDMRAELVVIKRRHSRSKETEVASFHLVDQRRDLRSTCRSRRHMARSFSVQHRRLPIRPFQIHGFEEGVHHPPVVYGLDFTLSHARESKQQREYLEKRLTVLSACLTACGIRCDIVLKPGLPADSIASYVTQQGYDLMIMGTHGRRGISHVLMGSIADAMLRHAPCPVLTVRQLHVGAHYQRILPLGDN